MKNPLLLTPSGRNTYFNGTDLSFADYIQQTRTMIEKTRLDLNSTNRERILQANSPNQHIPQTPSRYGILLIHGLFGSPAMMHSLFTHFQQKNYAVRSLLLPGHGTRPGDLLTNTMEDWLAAVEYGINSFRNSVQKLVVIGLSAGALVTLYHLLHNTPLQTTIDGLILFSPALRLKHPLAYYTHWHSVYSWIGSRLQWIRIEPETDYANYRSITYQSVTEIAKLSTLVTHSSKQHPLHQPIYIVQSADDAVIRTDTVLDFFIAQPNPLNRLCLYSKHPQEYTDPRITTVCSAHPQQRILDYSHVCLPIAPEHPHYGINSDYPDRGQYINARGKHPRHKQPYYWGEINAENTRKHCIQRLMYNPDFHNLVKRLDTFLLALD